MSNFFANKIVYGLHEMVESITNYELRITNGEIEYINFAIRFFVLNS